MYSMFVHVQSFRFESDKNSRTIVYQLEHCGQVRDQTDGEKKNVIELVKAATCTCSSSDTYQLAG